MGVGCVFDDEKIVSLGEWEQAVEIDGQAAEVDRDYGLGAVGDGGFDGMG